MAEESQEPVELVDLRTSGGASATVFPGKGMNCIALRFPAEDGFVEAIHSEPDITTTGSPTHSGIPVLFPFPNRIANAQYEWDGRTYQLPVDPHQAPNAALRSSGGVVTY